MDEPLFRLWSYLSTHPLSGLTATLIAYVVADWIWTRAGRTPLLNPVLLAIIAIAGALAFAEIPYAAYFDGAQFIHVMLGPATVALALPLYRTAARIRAAAGSVLGALLFGCVFAAVAATGLAWVFGASPETLASIAPKSATTPVAMAVADGLGGLPSLTAVLVIMTGVVGATFGGLVLDLARVRDHRARGFAVGLACHGVGTARAFMLSETAGAFASLAMALNALATAALMPALVSLLYWATR